MRTATRDREAVLRALLLGERLSLRATALAAATLGEGTTGNRDIQALLAIHASPGVTPGALARATGMQPSATTRSVSHLVERGLVSRSPSPADGRSAHLRLTRLGASRVRAFDRDLTAWCVSEAPTIKELVVLLDVDVTPVEGTPRSVLGVLEPLARAGADYLDEVIPVLASAGVHDETGRYALTLLADRGTMRPSSLAFELGISAGGASDLITRLEADGLVDRHHDDHSDRRVVSVRLTPRGTEVVEAKIAVFARHARTILTPLAATLTVRESA